MRFPIAFFFSLVFSITSAAAQTAAEVKQDVLSALSTPLPITVIGPLITRDVNVTADGNGFRVQLDNALLMGLVPLGSLSFKMTPEASNAQYRVTEFKFPENLEIFNAVTLDIGSTEFDGLWSSSSRSYQTLAFKLNNLTVKPKQLAGASVALGSLALNVDKEGQSNATESRFSLTASDLVSKGISADDFAASRIVAELKADGREPVDLYAVISRFAILAAMQPDQNALVQFAESLRAKSYDTVSLNFALDELAMRSNAPGTGRRLRVERIAGLAGITEMTPDEWGEVVLNVDSSGISESGYLELEKFEAAGGNVTLSGSQIPIGATLSAITRLRAISNGQTVRIKATDLLDGFLKFGRLNLTSSARGIAILPRNKDRGSMEIGSYNTGFTLDGFRNLEGKISFKSKLSDLRIIPGKFTTSFDERIFRTLNPKTVRYDLTISDLNEGLLRKLAQDLVVSSENDLPGLAAPGIAYFMAMKPLIETKDARFVSDEVDAAASGQIRFYPAWALSGLAYEGRSRSTLAGFDNIVTLVEDIENSPEFAANQPKSNRTTLALVKGALSTLKALATTEDGKLAWYIVYPEAGTPLFVINGVTMRFPDLASYMPLIGLGAAFR